MQFLALPRGIDLHAQPAAIRSEAKKARIERELGPSLLRAASQRRDQTRALDDEIRPG
jgi:hypothetical protein